jgi:UDP-N-acetyl-D-mannosaminuronate dehydrogenase
LAVRKTLVVGLGEVGEPLARILERCAPVMRQDLEPREFNEPAGTMHICFPFTDGAKFIEAAIGYIKRFNPELTIINSTVLPGTTRAIARVAKVPICYSPVRGKHTRMTEALLDYTKFVAGNDDEAVTAGIEHFQFAGMKTQRIRSLETLELAKLAETTYFGVCIAFAQELNRYANATGADYDEAVEFFKEVEFLPAQTYFPGFIGGHCVIPNIDLLLKVASSPLLEAVLDSNQRRAREIAASSDACPEVSKGAKA